jgi:hypothetical protein
MKTSAKSSNGLIGSVRGHGLGHDEIVGNPLGSARLDLIGTLALKRADGEQLVMKPIPFISAAAIFPTPVRIRRGHSFLARGPGGDDLLHGSQITVFRSARAYASNRASCPRAAASCIPAPFGNGTVRTGVPARLKGVVYRRILVRVCV